MLLVYLPYCCPSFIVYSLIIWGFTGYAYRVNAKLSANDPNKKDFRPRVILFAPITILVLILVMISLFILKAILYGIFLVLFTLALVFIRKPFIFEWLDKVAKKIGTILLGVDAQFIKMFSSPWSGNRPQPS